MSVRTRTPAFAPTCCGLRFRINSNHEERLQRPVFGPAAPMPSQAMRRMSVIFTEQGNDIESVQQNISARWKAMTEPNFTSYARSSKEYRHANKTVPARCSIGRPGGLSRHDDRQRERRLVHTWMCGT